MKTMIVLLIVTAKIRIGRLGHHMKTMIAVFFFIAKIRIGRLCHHMKTKIVLLFFTTKLRIGNLCHHMKTMIVLLIFTAKLRIGRLIHHIKTMTALILFTAKQKIGRLSSYEHCWCSFYFCFKISLTDVSFNFSLFSFWMKESEPVYSYLLSWHKWILLFEQVNLILYETMLATSSEKKVLQTCAICAYSDHPAHSYFFSSIQWFCLRTVKVLIRLRGLRWHIFLRDAVHIASWFMTQMIQRSNK